MQFINEYKIHVTKLTYICRKKRNYTLCFRQKQILLDLEVARKTFQTVEKEQVIMG